MWWIRQCSTSSAEWRGSKQWMKKRTRSRRRINYSRKTVENCSLNLKFEDPHPGYSDTVHSGDLSFFYWGLFCNTASIFNPKVMLLRHNYLSSTSSSVRFLLIMLFSSSIHLLFLRLAPVFGIPLVSFLEFSYCHPLQMSKLFQSYFLYYFNNITLGINNFSSSIPNFLISWCPCCLRQKFISLVNNLFAWHYLISRSFHQITYHFARMI